MKFRSFTALLTLIGVTACGVEDGAGSLEFTQLDGETVWLDGEIGSRSLEALEAYLEDHPDTEILVFGDMPGSMDDAANFILARFVRDQGFATHIPATGEAYTGAGDLFLAGAERTMDSGAIFGVHSWCGDTYTGRGIPQRADHPDHAPYIAYFRDMGMDDPAGYYSFTLDTAPLTRCMI